MKLFLLLVISLHLLSVATSMQWCEKDMYQAEIQTTTGGLDALVLWFPVRAGAHNVLPLCSNHTGLPIERLCSYNRQSSNATWDVIDKRTKLLNCSVIVNNCKDESFEHYYVMKNKKTEKTSNKWQPAGVGEQAKTQKPCLLETGMPLTRKCLYNTEHYMAEWENKDFKDIKCLHDINQQIVTYDLNVLYQDVKGSGATNDQENIQVADKLTNLLAKDQTIRIAADLDISTNILKVLTLDDKEPELMPKVLNATNLLMECDNKVVFSSNKLNTPNSLIKTIETYLDGMTNVLLPNSKCSELPAGVLCNSQNLTSVFYVNPFCSNVSGIAVYNSAAHPSVSMHYDEPTNTYFRYLYLNQSLEELINEPHLEVATYFPESLWQKLLSETSGKINMEAMRISLYKNRNFFVEQQDNGQMPDSVILTISIPGYKGDLPADVPLILRHDRSDEHVKPQCGYWNYQSWNSTGITTTTELNHQNLILCKTAHLTPFAVVLGIHFEGLEIANSVVLTIMNESTLDIISIAGCTLSLFGLVCIWLMALCYKQWRSQSSNKLLLNMCFVLTLIMVYFLFINITNLRDAIFDMKNPIHCIAMGAFLQYTILVLFLWMLFIAFLQYQRYVTVIGVERPRHFILKYALVAWGLPMLPTALVIYFDPKSYMPSSEDSNAICYPSGHSLYFAIMLPICLIIVANFGIFLYILCSIHRSFKKFKRTQDRKDFVLQVRLSILLFFLLGISWIFGILAQMNESVVFSFLFCLTSTLQGFILFIYSLVIDKNTRLLWLKCCTKDYYATEETAMSPLTSYNSEK